MPPRKRRGGARRGVSPTPTTWTVDLYALWRGGLSPAEISQLLADHGARVSPAEVERLALQQATAQLRAIWARGT
jgi:hypothetical protein